MKQFSFFVKKSLVPLALASVSLSYMGCRDDSPRALPQTSEGYSVFTNFGKYKIGKAYRPAMVAADFDGDGAVDVAFMNSASGMLTIYQNRIPQKGKTNTLERAVERR